MANEKRLIDANALKWKIGQVCLYVASLRCGKTIISKILGSYRNAVFEEIDNAPTVDAVEVVRCKDCKHSYMGVANLMCGRCGQNINGIRVGGSSVKEEHFCSYGEMRVEE